METVGGLGMLWYSAKEFGDFSLKLQYKEVRTDSGWSNGGVFVRFPDPRIPLVDRPQRYEYTFGDDTYGTSPRRALLAPGQRGDTARVGGDQLRPRDPGQRRSGWRRAAEDGLDLQLPPRTTSRRHGPGRRASGPTTRSASTVSSTRSSARARSSTGSTTRSRGSRRAAVTRRPRRGSSPRAYIGLQNHGASDRVRYRNVRVTDLSPDARAGDGPFEVSGRGTHTVEFRSIDWAGNIEEKRATTFRIGTAAAGERAARGGRGADVRARFAPAPEARRPGAARAEGQRRLHRPDAGQRGADGLARGQAAARRRERDARAPVGPLRRRRGRKTVTLKPSRKAARALRRSKRAVKTHRRGPPRRQRARPPRRSRAR